MHIFLTLPIGGLLLLFILLIPFFRRGRLFRRNRRQLSILMDQRGVDYVVFDVRNQKEYQSSHLKGAVSFPYDKIDHLPLEDMFIHIFVYGKKPKQSRRALTYLSDRGYFNVHDIGAFQGWKGPLEEGPGRSVNQLEEENQKRKKNESL